MRSSGPWWVLLAATNAGCLLDWGDWGSDTPQEETGNVDASTGEYVMFCEPEATPALEGGALVVPQSGGEHAAGPFVSASAFRTTAGRVLLSLSTTPREPCSRIPIDADAPNDFEASVDIVLEPPPRSPSVDVLWFEPGVGVSTERLPSPLVELVCPSSLAAFDDDIPIGTTIRGHLDTNNEGDLGTVIARPTFTVTFCGDEVLGAAGTTTGGDTQ